MLFFFFPLYITWRFSYEEKKSTNKNTTGYKISITSKKKDPLSKHGMIEIGRYTAEETEEGGHKNNNWVYKATIQRII